MKLNKNRESIRSVPKHRAPKSKGSLIYVLSLLVVLALVGGGAYLVLNKPQKTASPSAMQAKTETKSTESNSPPSTTQTRTTEAVNQKDTQAAASDAELDQDLANLDAKINQLDLEIQKTDDGLNDSPVNLN